jgi:tRNA-dihydrouridine synthase
MNPEQKQILPWKTGQTPLMLAPMQGLTNQSLRCVFASWVAPDTLFTEFMRVAPGDTKKRIAQSDLREIAAEESGIPLVVQLIGHGTQALADAALLAQKAGACHINLNLGCPYGRMGRGLTGGGILQQPELLNELIPALRSNIKGGFSIKLRAGYDDPRQIFSLLPLFESCQVDFLVLHPRTVVQEYTGLADHSITAEVVRSTSIPVIANGDVRTAEYGLKVLEQTNAAGLMIGRGAIADPLLFKRLRDKKTARPSLAEQKLMLEKYLSALLPAYQERFCGEAQTLGKIKTVLANMDDPELARQIKGLKKARTIKQFAELVKQLSD